VTFEFIMDGSNVKRIINVYGKMERSYARLESRWVKFYGNTNSAEHRIPRMDATLSARETQIFDAHFRRGS